MRPALALSLLLCALWPAALAARPYTVEDLLATEAFGEQVLDPTGRWLVIEHRRPWKAAARFDFNLHTTALLTRLEVVDLRRPGPAAPLFDQDPAAGYLAGPIAPDGAHMLVYRLQGHSFEAGLVTLQTRQVRWLGVTPELAVYGRIAQWRSPREVALIARPDGDLPRQLSLGWEAGQRLVQAWADTAAGQAPSRTRWGSGRFLAVKPEPKPSCLIAIDAETGVQRRLAQGEFVDLELSRSGRYAALIANLEEIQPQADDRVSIATPSRRRGLVLVDLDTGAAGPACPDGDMALHLMSWAPDRDELLIAQRRPDRAWDARDLVRIEAAARRCRPIALNGLTPAFTYSGEDAPFLHAAWMGRDPIVYARSGPKGRPDWYRLGAGGSTNLTARLPPPPPSLAELRADQAVLLIDQALWRIDRRGHAAKLADAPGATFARAFAGATSRLRENPDPPQDGMATVDPQGFVLFRNRTGAPASRLPLPPGAELTSLGRGQAVALQRDPDGRRRLLVSGGAGPWTPVLEINTGLADISPATIEAVHHKGPGGERLTSWLYRPADRATDEALPLVVVPYRGQVFPAPARRFEPGEWNDAVNIQVLVGAGYAVLTPSLPYDPAQGEPTAGMADDILRAVDAALAQGGLDPHRIALFGHSFGALGAVAAAAQSPRFRSVIASAGVHDEISEWGVFPLHQGSVPEDGYAPNLTAGIVEQAQTRLGAPPWADPERYLRNSNLFAAGRITAPVLILHGETDELRATQAQELFSAFYRQGKDAILVTYWGEGHTFSSPANIRDKYATILDWLAQTLSEPPQTITQRTTK